MTVTFSGVFTLYARARPSDQLDAIILAELRELRRQLPETTSPDIVESLDLAQACAEELARRVDHQRRHYGE